MTMTHVLPELLAPAGGREQLEAAILYGADAVYLCHFPENATKEPGIDIDIHEIGQYISRASIIKEDEEAAEELAKYHDVVYLFMSSKDIYKLEEKVISCKEKEK